MDNETIYTAIKIGALITGSYYIGRDIGKCILSDYITKVLGSSQISFTSKDKTDGLILRDNLIKLKDKYPIGSEEGGRVIDNLVSKLENKICYEKWYDKHLSLRENEKTN